MRKLITARARKNKRTASMLAYPRKDHSITLVCHAFKIDKNAIREAGVIRSEKYSAVPTYAAIRSKKIQLLAQLAQREKQRLLAIGF